MKAKFKVEQEFDVRTILVEASVRYWEDATINGIEDNDGLLIPCSNDDSWSPIICIETGEIKNWEIGKDAIIHYKVCDAGEYFLQNEKGDKIAKHKGYYVPEFLSIGDNGFGDYIILKVSEEGFIYDWFFNEDDIKAFKHINKEL